MKKLSAIDTMELIGLSGLVVGVGLEFGLAFGMITLGVVLLGYSIVSRRAGVRK